MLAFREMLINYLGNASPQTPHSAVTGEIDAELGRMRESYPDFDLLGQSLMHLAIAVVPAFEFCAVGEYVRILYGAARFAPFAVERDRLARSVQEAAPLASASEPEKVIVQ
jgi:hypothetical protein